MCWFCWRRLRDLAASCDAGLAVRGEGWTLIPLWLLGVCGRQHGAAGRGAATPGPAGGAAGLMVCVAPGRQDGGQGACHSGIAPRRVVQWMVQPWPSLLKKLRRSCYIPASFGE